MSDLDVQLPSAFDPFAEANAEDSGAGPGAKDYVHVRIQQRNGRKSLTCSGLKEGVQLQQDPQGSEKGVLLQWYCSPRSRAWPGHSASR